MRATVLFGPVKIGRCCRHQLFAARYSTPHLLLSSHDAVCPRFCNRDTHFQLPSKPFVLIRAITHARSVLYFKNMTDSAAFDYNTPFTPSRSKKKRKNKTSVTPQVALDRTRQELLKGDWVQQCQRRSPALPLLPGNNTHGNNSDYQNSYERAYRRYSLTHPKFAMFSASVWEVLHLPPIRGPSWPSC